MPMLPQQQPNQSAAGATQAAMQQAQQPQQPQNPQQPSQPAQPQQAQQSGEFASDPEIAQNLEQHLNQLNPKQKAFLAGAIQHYANIVIPVLGIVCGQEVFEYFVNLYKQHFATKGGQQTTHPATGQQQNLAPQQAPNQGQPQAQPQAVQQPQQQTPQQ